MSVAKRLVDKDKRGAFAAAGFLVYSTFFSFFKLYAYLLKYSNFKLSMLSCRYMHAKRKR